MTRILIVEDEESYREPLVYQLTREGYDVSAAASGEEGLELFTKGGIDLVLLDLMLPGIDGTALCRRIREQSRVPIIMLTAKSAEIDKVVGLEIGADDYVTKPFTPMELLARVNSQLRRYRNFMGRLKEKEEKEHIYTIGGLELNEDRKAVSVDGEDVKVTPTEYKILLLLMKHPGRVFSADEIYEWVWEEEAVNTDTIMVHVRNIREKIEINPKEPKYLKVVWGVGYKIEKQA
mgnify:CR=1 FL=1